MTGGNALAQPVRPTQHDEFIPCGAQVSRRTVTLAIVAASAEVGDACLDCFGLADNADAKCGYVRF